jgi:hypothetical protein
LDGVIGFVGGDLEVEKEIVNGRLTVGGRVIAPRGAVIASTLDVAGRVEVQQLAPRAAGPSSSGSPRSPRSRSSSLGSRSSVR